MLNRLPRIVATAALVAIPTVACGGGSSTATGCGASTTTSPEVVARALDSLKFDQSEYSAKAGDINLQLVNDGSLPHTLVVRGKDCKLSTGSRGDAKTGKINLTPGSYEVFCDVPGHEAGGMKATLKVT